jgi:hypothetical protein
VPYESRDEAKAAWLRRIDAHLAVGEYRQASDLLDRAERELPGDVDLAGRRRVVEIAYRFDDRLTQPPAEGEADAGADAGPYERTRIVPHRRQPDPSPSEDKTVVMSGRHPLAPPVSRQPDPPPQELDLDRLAAAPPSGEDATVQFQRGDIPQPPAQARPRGPHPKMRPAAPPKPPFNYKSPVLWATVAGAAVVVTIAVVLLLPNGEEPPRTLTSVPEPPPPPPPITTTVPPVEPPPVDPAPPPPPPPGPRQGQGRVRVPPLTGGPTQPILARLVLQQFEAGTSVSIDGQAIDRVGADGTLTRGGISPGRHSLQFDRPGHEPLTMPRDFADGATVTLSGASLAWRPVTVQVQFRADPNVEYTVKLRGTPTGNGKGSAVLALRPGEYQVTSKGPPGVELTDRLTVAAGDNRIVEVRSVTGMERFTGWTSAGSWYSKRGGNFARYDGPSTEGRYEFTVQLDRSGNPFTTGGRLTCVVSYTDDRNLTRIQLDRNNFYHADLVNNRERDEAERRHQIPPGGTDIQLAIQITSRQIVTQFRAASGAWQTIDTWDRQQALPNFRFGFILPGNDQLTIANFRFVPR